MSRIYVLTLGCDKNRVDGEVMIGSLRLAGYQVVDSPDIASVIIVNTCGFIRDASRESIEMILELAEYKKTHGCRALVVVGCMAERYKDEIIKDMPEIDVCVGVGQYEKIAEVVREFIEPTILSGESFLNTPQNIRLAARADTKMPHTAYVKIAEGCDTNCTYCTIPSIRGAYKSRPIEDIVSECRQLVDSGVKELILVAQDTALYGQDIYGVMKLPELLTEISKTGVAWVRLMYVYPEHIKSTLIDALSSIDCVVKYIDMPLQHCEEKVLKKMGRGSGKYELMSLIRVLRERIEGLAIRTTLMVGFPGETEEDFDNLCDFVEEMRFERMGVFPFSQEEGTPASKMEHQVKENKKKARYKKLMLLQQKIHFASQKSFVGKSLRVIVDEFLADEGTYIGRAYFDAPETDSVIFFTSEIPLAPGDFCDVLITKTNGYDLVGKGRHK